MPPTDMEILTIALIQTQNHPWHGGKGLHVLKFCLISWLGISPWTCFSPAQEKSFLSNGTDSSPLLLVVLLWDLNQPNNVSHPRLVLLMSSYKCGSPVKALLPRTATSCFFFARAASAVNLFSANTGHRWMPSYKSNQQDNVLLSQEWTLMTKSPA